MKILVVSPHPDDEAIGCGGRIAMHAADGDEVGVLFLTSGELGCPGEEPEAVIDRREMEARWAAGQLLTHVLDFWREPDGGLQASSHLATRLAALVNEYKPDRIYVTNDQDAHSDHRAGAELVRMTLDMALAPVETFMYEVWTPFSSYDELVDISDFIGRKTLAIRKHESQVARVRFDEAALALARYRGELHNRPHGPWAEAYKRL